MIYEISIIRTKQIFRLTSIVFIHVKRVKNEHLKYIIRLYYVKNFVKFFKGEFTIGTFEFLFQQKLIYLNYFITKCQLVISTNQRNKSNEYAINVIMITRHSKNFVKWKQFKITNKCCAKDFRSYPGLL